MLKSQEQLRSMYLSGTVSIPPHFPELAEISFGFGGKTSPQFLVEATVDVSSKLTIKRTFFVDDVTCIFEPDDSTHVDLKKGKWYAGPHVEALASTNANRGAIQGILYVRENAQSLLEVQAGLTAAESAEYYLPLPDDRSVNHYEMGKGCGAIRAGCTF